MYQVSALNEHYSLLSYCLSDFLCSVYGIPLTENHLPERPEGSFGTVIKAPENSWSSQEETHPRGSRRSEEDNGPFAARDYRYYRGGASSEGTLYKDEILFMPNCLGKLYGYT